MDRRFELSRQPVPYEYLVELFDDTVFRLQKGALAKLTRYASEGNVAAREFISWIDHLDLNGKLTESGVIGGFGYCLRGHGPAREEGHRNGESKSHFFCDKCSSSRFPFARWIQDKPDVLIALEGMGQTWNRIHFRNSPMTG
jgi:hypothetical protein